MGATMKDIAKRTGLGLATISSYLNGGNVREKNRIKIEEAIEELHFEVNEVARGLKTNRTRTIGIVIPELNNIFFAEIITEAEDILRSHGYATMICDCRSDAEREKEAVEFLYHRRVDGLIVMPTGSSDPGFARYIRAGKPIVMIDRKMQDMSCDCILVDNEGAARDAVKRLVKAGHRKIGMIAGPEDVYTSRERLKGFREAVRQSGADADEALIAVGNYTIAGGAAAMRKLYKQNPDMTAVFISNYEMTVGAMMEINDLGIRVPDELSVIGFDNVDFARASVPKLSIVTQPTAMIAKSAADILLGRLEGRIPEEHENEDDADGQELSATVTLKTGFVEGRSVRTLRA